MNKKLSVKDKAVAIFLVIFSFLKLGNFLSVLYFIYKIKNLEHQGKYVPPFEKDYILNKWILAYELIGFVLYILLLYYGVGVLRGRKYKKNIVRTALATVFAYYPLVVICNYFVVGKHTLFALFPVYFSSSVLLLIVFYFLIFLKE